MNDPQTPQEDDECHSKDNFDNISVSTGLDSEKSMNLCYMSTDEDIFEMSPLFEETVKDE